MRFTRQFATPGKKPLDEVEYTTTTARITDNDGKVVFEMEGVEAPVAWSQLAVDIAASKYLRKSGVRPLGYENSIRQLVYRVAHTIRTEGRQRGYFDRESDAEAFEDDLSYLLIHQYGAFNSPVWFNCGLWHQYGIEGSGGGWHWNGEETVKTPNAYQYPQCSACFIQSVDDDLMSIFELVKNEARLFKYGSGTGTNFSKIRGRQERLSGGGTSSGLMSFLEVFDRGAGATKSGGTTRRAAKMVCLDVDHPEIMDFIRWKQREEKKAKALIAAGWPADFNGEAYRTVGGQNSNNSVRLSNTFMRAVESRSMWATTMRTTGEVCETFNASDILQEIAEAAWACADPGVQFDDIINDWNTCLNTDRIYGSNPCSEYHFLDNTACNLASINLLKFLSSGNTFDHERYKHACRVFFTAQEILVDFASYPTEQIAHNSHRYRPLGLGYANLGSLLMAMGIPYDSDRARGWTACLTAIMHGQAYYTSSELAECKGVFAAYNDNQTSMMRVIKKHREAGQNIPLINSPPAIWTEVQRLWCDVEERGTLHGFRNAQATVLAPTGTIGLLMDCDTTGIEPEFALVKYKKLAGGGQIKMINHCVPRALRSLGYSGDDIQAITDWVETHGTVEGCAALKPKDLAVFDCANKPANGSRFIAPLAHIEIMAAAQPFLSGAISKTVNVPSSATVQDIRDLYWHAWDRGLKCVAIYRDGCKASQPLNNTDDVEAPACGLCGGATVQSGTCHVCTECGSTAACS